MAEPSAEIPREFTVKDFLKIKEARLAGIPHSNEPGTVVTRSSLRDQITSIEEGLSNLVNENWTKQNPTGNRSLWDYDFPSSERARLIEEGRDKISLAELLSSYSQVTKQLRLHFDLTFGKRGYDSMSPSQRSFAIGESNCINLREGTQKEMEQFVKIFGNG